MEKSILPLFFMAAIDKTYIKTFEDYKSVIEWCKQIGEVTDDYGNVFSPYEYIYGPEVTKELWNKEVEQALTYKEAYEAILWNTPVFMDVWLIRYCPLDIIQNRLKEQYGDSYEVIKNRVSEYDTIDTSQSTKVKLISKKGKLERNKYHCYYVSIKNFIYNEKTDKWQSFYDLRIVKTWGCCYFPATCSLKSIYKKILRWKLPIGTIVEVSSNNLTLIYKTK